MSRIFVGGFLSALVLVIAYQGVSAQRNVPVTEAYSESLADIQPDLADCAIASCCQDFATEAVAQEPSLLLTEPQFSSERSFEFTVAAVESQPVFSDPIAQVSGEVAPRRQRVLPDPFAPASPADATFPAASDSAVADAEEEAAPALDRIWIMIHPVQGLQFLQTAEEVLLKKGQGAGTQEFFLIDCDKFSMEGKLGEGKPEFVLTCEAFSLEGAFRTAKALEIKGAKLIYDTGRQELTLSGTEATPVRVSIRDNDESKLQAEKIILKLNDNSYQMQVSGANMELITVPAKLQPTPENRSISPFGSF